MYCLYIAATILKIACCAFLLKIDANSYRKICIYSHLQSIVFITSFFSQHVFVSLSEVHIKREEDATDRPFSKVDINVMATKIFINLTVLCTMISAQYYTRNVKIHFDVHEFNSPIMTQLTHFLIYIMSSLLCVLVMVIVFTRTHLNSHESQGSSEHSFLCICIHVFFWLGHLLEYITVLF